jgi:acyl-coenzyme A synthetase/AMP-(fatty) acid ligase
MPPSAVIWPSSVMRGIPAFVVARDGADATAIIAHCRAALASYKVPREVFFVEALPKNSSGKILKKELVSRLVPIG